MFSGFQTILPHVTIFQQDHFRLHPERENRAETETESAGFKKKIVILCPEF